MGTKDRKHREREDRMQQILLAAERVIVLNGLQGLSMDLVAHEAELAKGTLYIYFESKDALLAELSLKARRMLLVAFQQAVHKQTTATDKLTSIVKANYFFYSHHPFYYDLVSLFESNANMPETKALTDASVALTLLIVEIVVLAQKEGTIRKEIDPFQFSICLWGATVGIMQFIKVRGKSVEENLGITPMTLLDTFNLILESGIKS